MRQKLYTYDVAENTCSYETICSSYNFTENFVHDDAKVAIEKPLPPPSPQIIATKLLKT